MRQILNGQHFFKEEFGVTANVLWLPDVFGYSRALPQILKRSGIDSFMTIKISWNQYNHMPHDTFRDAWDIDIYYQEKGYEVDNLKTVSVEG